MNNSQNQVALKKVHAAFSNVLADIFRDLMPELLNHPKLTELILKYVFQNQTTSVKGKKITLIMLRKHIYETIPRTRRGKLEPLLAVLEGLGHFIDVKGIRSHEELEARIQSVRLVMKQTVNRVVNRKTVNQKIIIHNFRKTQYFD